MKVRPPGKPRGYDVDVVTPRVWRLVAGRTLLGTDNAGRTWTNITASVALSQASQVLFTTPDVGWDLPCCGISDNVRHTSDGGGLDDGPRAPVTRPNDVESLSQAPRSWTATGMCGTCPGNTDASPIPNASQQLLNCWPFPSGR